MSDLSQDLQITQSRQYTRRRFLSFAGAAWTGASALSAALPLSASASDASSNDNSLYLWLKRLLGSHAAQIHLYLLEDSTASSEHFSITGIPGRIEIEGSTRSALMTGVHRYLRSIASVSISWNGDCLDHLPAILPAPAEPIEQRTSVPHRFALNDTNDGYTGPYWTWAQWERQIDVLALHGINEVLVYIGAEAVYQKTFHQFGYSYREMCGWFPTPAHQPWWLLGNMSGWVGPKLSQHLIDSRVELAAKITHRLRELGMTPVLPGFYGMVPNDFAAKNPGARIVPQGDWLGIKRPDWLDPTCEHFARVAETYYRKQEQLLGLSTLFKMDPLHEGGKLGGVSLEQAAAAIEAALQKAHPGATWAIIGWLNNPKRELLAGIRDKSRMLILDGLSDRYTYKDREEEWSGTPYAFGAIWNFGGHTTIGANCGVWNERYCKQLTKPRSALSGIAVMPEASCNNPAAFALLTDLAWRSEPLNLTEWFAEWSAHRYGGHDEHAARAWDVLRSTAYDGRSGQWSEAHDNLFSAEPSLEAKSAAAWSPEEPRYELAAFAEAIRHLLQVSPMLHASSAYRYDLVDVARQTVANQSRVLLPKIKAAFAAMDATLFRQLTEEWLSRITLLDRITGAEPAFLLGPWLEAARSAGKTVAEQDQLEFDARSVLIEWGPRSSADSGVHDYANREWNGLLLFYRERWSHYFTSLSDALAANTAVRPIDWFAFNEAWAKQTTSFAMAPEGNAYELINSALPKILLTATGA